MKDQLLIAFAVRLHEAMICRNVRVKELAKRARIKKGRLKRILRAEKDIDIRTASDLFVCLDLRISFNLVPRDEPQSAPAESPASAPSPEADKSAESQP